MTSWFLLPQPSTIHRARSLGGITPGYTRIEENGHISTFIFARLGEIFDNTPPLQRKQDKDKQLLPNYARQTGHMTIQTIRRSSGQLHQLSQTMRVCPLFLQEWKGYAGDGSYPRRARQRIKAIYLQMQFAFSILTTTALSRMFLLWGRGFQCSLSSVLPARERKNCCREDIQQSS
jgi:hypothetical protein